MPDFLGSWAIRGRNSVVHHRTLNHRNVVGIVSKRGHSYRQAGFTIIELVVVTAIIALITGLILVSDSTFGGKVLLENLAYDMALSIRQAQVYGISVQRFNNVFSAGYGVHFDTSPANQYNYLTFADASCVNGIYDTVGGACLTSELVNTTQLERGFRIAKLCAPAGTDSTSCTSVNTLDILFRRPEPDAMISANGTPCIISPFTCYGDARIVVKSPRGDLDSIVVSTNGQISVQKL